MVRGEHRCGQVVGHRDRPHEALGLVGETARVGRTGLPSIGKHRHQRIAHAGTLDGVEIGVAGDDEARRDGEPARGQLPEVGPLPAHRSRVAEPDVFEPSNRLHVVTFRKAIFGAPQPWSPTQVTSGRAEGHRAGRGLARSEDAVRECRRPGRLRRARGWLPTGQETLGNYRRRLPLSPKARRRPPSPLLVLR